MDGGMEEERRKKEMGNSVCDYGHYLEVFLFGLELPNCPLKSDWILHHPTVTDLSVKTLSGETNIYLLLYTLAITPSNSPPLHLPPPSLHTFPPLSLSTLSLHLYLSAVHLPLVITFSDLSM